MTPPAAYCVSTFALVGVPEARRVELHDSNVPAAYAPHTLARSHRWTRSSIWLWLILTVW